jgi:hypothetical protein
MDNDLPNHIVVFLGDLGKLHYDEQLYWKSFNIPPVADRSSEVHFKRSYLAEFADPVSPDLVLKQKLVGLQEAWERACSRRWCRARGCGRAHPNSGRDTAYVVSDPGVVSP